VLTITHELLALVLGLTVIISIYFGTQVQGWMLRVYHRYTTPISKDELRRLIQ